MTAARPTVPSDETSAARCGWCSCPLPKHAYGCPHDTVYQPVQQRDAEIAALRARVRELESAPTSGEVASLVKALYARGQKIEWDGGDVSADQQILHAADVIARLDRERQEFRRWHESSCEQWRVAVGVAVARAERAEAERDALRRIIEWALGEGDDFPDWPPTVTIHGNPKFWWRTELRKRFDAAIAASGEGEGEGEG